MEILQAIILGVVQGFTEFLPVSSSAHLVIIPKVMGWSEQPLFFDILVHGGTLVAIISYYRHRIVDIVKELFGQDRQRRRIQLGLFRNLILTTIPTIIAFIFVKDFLDNKFQSVNIIIFSLIIWGMLLIIADLYSKRRAASNPLDAYRAAFIGIGQGLSLIRGVSRSGAMITLGLFSGVERKALVEYVFLAGIPVIMAGLFLEIYEYSHLISLQTIPSMLAGFVSSLLSGLIAIKLIDRLIEKNLLLYSGIYRIILAIILIVFL